MWSDEKDDIMSLLNDNKERYPRICPCCGKESGHVFMYKDGCNIFGSAWAWCSECHEFSHSRFLIPDWWVNHDAVSIDQLHASPDNLDDIRDDLDKWINGLINK